MAVLRAACFSTLIATLLLSLSAMSAPDKKSKQEADAALAKAMKDATEKLCHSTAEYIKVLKFLRETKEFSFREDVSRKIADSVSKGCDGAAERFSVVLLLLKSIGLSERKAMEMALEFSAQAPDVQKNFVEIFTNSYLSEFFDFEYTRAMQLAIELSKGYKGDPTMAREDFIKLVKFCKATKSLDLPMRLCSDYMAKIAKSSQYYPSGVAKHFLDLFQTLREKKEFQLDVKTTLRVADEILRSGPTAPQNFFDAFSFSRSDLDYDKRKALDFAMVLASRSFIGQEPPIMQFPQPKRAEQ